MKKSATFIASATIAVFLTGCIIVIHDISPGFKQLLVSLTGHHWTSVSLIIIVLFALFSGLFSSSESMRKFLRVYNIGLWTTAMLIVTLLMIVGILVELTFRFLAD
ncbi:hypothetical protein [Methanosarcina sp.]|uniref:hypothetical protein n=1 Tax=Methanosarcina sp. TaxID=2213 RepID=UPI00298806F4|nr:hypothetical protein [Methanosarcina sp.]MDW5558213.1 hypothetical protein [Methanosarcina sp.]